jgi:hypothetical protein
MDTYKYLLAGSYFAPACFILLEPLDKLHNKKLEDTLI